MKQYCAAQLYLLPCIVQCAVCSVQCAVCSVQCEVYTVQFAVCRAIPQVMALWQNGRKYPAVVQRQEPDGAVSVQVLIDLL